LGGRSGCSAIAEERNHQAIRPISRLKAITASVNLGVVGRVLVLSEISNALTDADCYPEFGHCPSTLGPLVSTRRYSFRLKLCQGNRSALEI
jgi:hypothetical protein